MIKTDTGSNNTWNYSEDTIIAAISVESILASKDLYPSITIEQDNPDNDGIPRIQFKDFNINFKIPKREDWKSYSFVTFNPCVYLPNTVFKDNSIAYSKFNTWSLQLVTSTNYPYYDYHEEYSLTDVEKYIPVLYLDTKSVIVKCNYGKVSVGKKFTSVEIRHDIYDDVYEDSNYLKALAGNYKVVNNNDLKVIQVLYQDSGPVLNWYDPITTDVDSYEVLNQSSSSSHTEDIQNIVLPNVKGAVSIGGPTGAFKLKYIPNLKCIDAGYATSLTVTNIKEQTSSSTVNDLDIIIRSTEAATLSFSEVPAVKTSSSYPKCHLYIPSDLFMAYRREYNYKYTGIEYIALEGSKYENPEWIEV